MDSKRTLEEILAPQVVERAHHMKRLGYRLSEMHCTRLKDGTEINYAYDLDGDYVIHRTRIADDATLPSITGIYPCAFLYENEMQDLFGIQVTDMTVDYKGHLYKLKQQTPYRPADAAVAATPAVPATDVSAAPAGKGD